MSGCNTSLSNYTTSTIYYFSHEYNDNTEFVDEKILAHTFTVIPNDKSKESAMYFEVTNDGVIKCQSDIK